MNKTPLSIFDPKTVAQLKRKHFDIRRKGPVTLVRCTTCNWECSIHHTENKETRRNQLGQHFLSHLP